MAKFKDPETDEVVDYLTYKTVFNNDGTKTYKDKFNKVIANENGKPLLKIEKERKPGDPFECPSLLKFDSGSQAHKRKVLKERSSADYKRNYEEKKQVQQGDALEQLKNIVTKK